MVFNKTISISDYQFGIKLTQRLDNRLLITFNARNDHDRCKFVEDIRETICEMDEMENLRIESELERHRHGHNNRYVEICIENRFLFSFTLFFLNI